MVVGFRDSGTFALFFHAHEITNCSVPLYFFGSIVILLYFSDGSATRSRLSLSFSLLFQIHLPYCPFSSRYYGTEQSAIL